MKLEASKQVKPIPPDGGWGWIIVMSSFMCNVIVDGVVYSFGVFLPKLVDHFDQGKGGVAWIGSLLVGVQFVVGPICSVLINKFGYRITCMTGGLVGMSAFALATLSNSLAMMIILYGLIGSFGLGMVYSPAVLCVGQYFEKKRALAVGISLCGSGIGPFVLAPLVAHLLDQYDWRGANLILAGLVLNCVIFGALMRPLESTKNENLKDLHGIENGSFVVDSANSNNTDVVQVQDSSLTCTNKEPDQENKDHDRIPITDFSLMKNPSFIFLVVSYLFGFMGFAIPYMYIVDAAITKGVGDQDKTSFLISAIGIGSTLGRIVSGYITDLPAINSILVTAFCTLVSSLAAFSVPFCSDYISFCVVSVLYGMFSGPFIALSSIVVVDLLDISQVVNAFGLLCLFDGIALIIGPPIAGVVFDKTLSYEWPFWFASIMLFMSSILFVTSFYFGRFLKNKK